MINGEFEFSWLGFAEGGIENICIPLKDACKMQGRLSFFFLYVDVIIIVIVIVVITSAIQVAAVL